MPDRIEFSEAVRKLRHFHREHRRAPSFSEVARLFRYKSKNAASFLIRKLAEKGLLRQDATGRILFDTPGVKLLGTVQAGWPSPAEEELVDTLNLDEYLIRRPEQTFLIKVTGDSMVDAGIREGDLVLVERGREPRDKDIVIAELDGEWTMKYYEKSARGVRLVAANKKYPPIVPRQKLTVGGVVVAVVRKYK